MEEAFKLNDWALIQSVRAAAKGNTVINRPGWSLLRDEQAKIKRYRESRGERKQMVHLVSASPASSRQVSDGAEEMRYVVLAKEGDREAFAHLIEQHWKYIWGVCRNILGSSFSNDDIEDVVQEAVVKAWNQVAKYEGRSPFRSWVARIAANRCIDELRRKHSVQIRNFPEEWDEDDSHNVSIRGARLWQSSSFAEQNLQHMAELAIDFDRCWSSISPEDRLILTLLVRVDGGLKDVGRLYTTNSGSLYNTGKYHARKALLHVKNCLDNNEIILAPSEALELLQEKGDLK